MAFTLYDDDDLRFTCENMIDWHNGDGNNFYNGGTHNSISGVQTISRVRFKINGTMFRLYVQCHSDGRNTNVNVIIDGIYITTINAPQQTINGHILYYTSPTLIIGDHDIVLEHDNSKIGYMMFDGVDTDGFIYAKLGAIVPNAELGWSRVDDIDSKFAYIGSWSRRSDGSNYSSNGSTWIESQVTGDTIAFSMKSTKLRVYAYGNIDTSGFDIKIDGVQYNSFNTTYGIARCVLAAEITGLTNDRHFVELIVKDKSTVSGSTLTRLLFDCIDIDDTGFLYSTGLVLNNPEAGWFRYDDTDTSILYTNMKSMNTGDSTNYVNGTVHITDDIAKPSSVRIKTTGTKIRLICKLAENRNSKVQVYVDGEHIETFNAPDIGQYGKTVYYESEEFSHPDKKFITFEFRYLNSECNAMFDCCDINGYIAANQSLEDYIQDDSDISYTFNSQAMNSLKIEYPGIYAVECFGANGGGNQDRSAGSRGGMGGYTYGEVYFNQDDILYVYPGGQGSYATGYFNGGGFNGGGNGGSGGYGGGGASDVRLRINDLNHRIVVAGGGGGADNATSEGAGGGDDGSGGDGGGLVAQGFWINGGYYSQYGGAQTSGYALGIGQSATVATDTGGAGGGYFGGLVSNNSNGGAGGGSSYYGNMMNAYTVGGVNWGNGLVKITLLKEDNYNNLQHFAIFTENKYFIPTEKYFDLKNMSFMEVSMDELYNPNLNPEELVTDIADIVKTFTVNDKLIYPLEYIRSLYDVRIVKIMCHNVNLPSVINNKNRRKVTFYTDFNNLFKSTLIKLKDSINIKLDEMANYITLDHINKIKFGIESNSTLYGMNFEIISESDIKAKGFDYVDLSSLEIPFDNIRIFALFTGNCNSGEELKLLKIIKKSKNLKMLLTDEDYLTIIKEVRGKNNIYIKLLSDKITSITVNKLAQDEKEYMVENTFDTF